MVVLVIALFVVSCTRVPAGERPQDTAAVLKAVQSGTQGVVVKPTAHFPPATVYDQTELVMIVDVNNRGNHNLERQDCWIQVTGFDPNIIRGSWMSPRSCAENSGDSQLEGKNVYNLEGGFNQIEYKSSNIDLPENVYEYNPTLNILACYNYHTKASPQVCVDPLFYQVSSEQKTCLPHDVTLGGGQGAPVGVSYVGVDMVGNRAIFEMNIVNHGTGRVVSPDAHLQDCGTGQIEYQDLDKVKFEIKMQGGSVISCKPSDNYVRLVNGRGKIVCSFQIEGTFAYETPLLIDLDYGYIDSYKQPIKIIDTPE